MLTSFLTLFFQLAFKTNKTSWEWCQVTGNEYYLKPLDAAMEGSVNADPQNAIPQLDFLQST